MRQVKSKTFVILSLFVLILLSFSMGYAEDYYVKNGGNDGADGLSDANAWATVSKVNSIAFAPGDTVHFNKGDIWRERLEIRVADSGSSGSVVTFTSYGAGNQPIISGADVETSWTQEGVYYYASNTVNTGIMIKDGVFMKRMPNKVDVDQVDEWWYDSVNSRVYIYFNPSANTMEVAGTRMWVCSVYTDAVYITIDDICFEGGDRGIYVYPVTTSNINIQNCTVRKCADWGIKASAQTNVLSCDISYIYDVGLDSSASSDGDASGYRWANNTISYAGYYMCTYQQGQGIYCRDANIVIEHNEVHHCGLGGTFGYDHGMYLRPTGGIVRYNNVHDNVCMGIGVAKDNMEVYYNLVYSNGIGIGHSYATTGCKINNNVIYKNTTAVNADECGFVVNDGVVAEFKNNIVYMNGGGASGAYDKQIWIRIGSPDDITDCDNNLIYGSDADQCRIVSTGYTWAEWQAAGYDANSINTSTHGMTDPDNANFILQKGSPCIDKGANVGLKKDYRGTLVPKGSAPDIGAYEYFKAIIIGMLRWQ